MCFSINGNILIVRFLNENWLYPRKSKYWKKNSNYSRDSKKIYFSWCEVFLIENYGSYLGIKDEQYKEFGANILKDETEVLNSSDIIVQLGILSDDKIEKIKENQTLIGVLNPYNNKEKLENLAKKINLFSLELLPRITRAQSMDILSSQANSRI